MLNRTLLVGRLSKDPDLRYTKNGVAVCNFTVAVKNPFSKNDDADFINCVTWKKQAENLANYMSKGSMIGVDGRIQTRSFEGQDGKRVYITEIVAEQVAFLDSKGQNLSKQPNEPQNANMDESDSGLPF